MARWQSQLLVNWTIFIPLCRVPVCSWVLRHLNEQSPGWEDVNQTFHELSVRCKSDSSHPHFHLFILHMYFLTVRKMAPYLACYSEHLSGFPQWLCLSEYCHHLAPQLSFTRLITIPSGQLLRGDGRPNNLRKVKEHSPLPYVLYSDWVHSSEAMCVSTIQWLGIVCICG